jgi:hypothetical protein
MPQFRLRKGYAVRLSFGALVAARAGSGYERAPVTGAREAAVATALAFGEPAPYAVVHGLVHGICQALLANGAGTANLLSELVLERPGSEE